MEIIIFMICFTVLAVSATIIGYMVWHTKKSFECKHIWNTVKDTNLVDDNGDKIGTLYLMQCQHCGELKFLKC